MKQNPVTLQFPTVVLTGIVAVVFVLGFAAGPAKADVGNGKIAYVEDGGTGNPQIFTANPDGTDQEQLTTDSGAGESNVQPA